MVISHDSMNQGWSASWSGMSPSAIAVSQVGYDLLSTCVERRSRPPTWYRLCPAPSVSIQTAIPSFVSGDISEYAEFVGACTRTPTQAFIDNEGIAICMCILKRDCGGPSEFGVPSILRNLSG